MGRSKLEKRRVQQADWVRRNPEKVRASRMKSRYGITPERYDEMYLEQGGLCAICRARPAKHVDHDHETEQVRDLLCGQCNQALGLMQENTGFLRAAAEYLENHAG